MKKLNEKIIIAVIIGLAIVGFALVDQQTKLKVLQEQERMETREREKEQLRQDEDEFTRNQKLLTCKLVADEKRHGWWAKECKSQGSKEDCRLPEYNADRIDASNKNDIDNCIKLYGQ
jgi:uncharacterized protein HemX